MAKEEQPSIFFSNFSGTAAASAKRPEYICSSKSGYSVLYRYDKEGKFRVLKALKAQFRGNPVYERLLRKEFEIGWELDHPNICKVYAFENIQGLGNCIEMEYVDGCTLDDFAQSEFSDKGALKRILCQTCDALAYIHHKQIIHRDLKPQNILVTHNGLNVKIIDFGLSDTDWHSVLKGSAGTREYAAPELLERGEIDNRTDIYSLGKIMLSMDRAYMAVAQKCTKVLPQDRYASAEEVKAAIIGTRRPLFKVAVALSIIALLAVVAVLLWKTAAPESMESTLDKIFIGVGEKIIEAQNR